MVLNDESIKILRMDFEDLRRNKKKTKKVFVDIGHSNTQTLQLQ